MAKAKKIRTEIPSKIAAKVLFDSDRTCCVCHDPDRYVQIHHIDGDPSNSALDNLAVLCFDCHRETQIRGGFDRKLDADQVIFYKNKWLLVVDGRSDRKHGPIIPKPTDKKAGRTPKFGQLREESEEYLYCFEADYPQIDSGDPSADEEMNLCINSFITRELQRFRARAIATFSERNKERESTGAVTTRDSLSISHKVSLFTADVLSIEFVVWNYSWGAAHPGHNTHTLNFLLRPPLQLELKDIFEPSSGYVEFLSEYCINDLHKQMPQTIPLGAPEDLRKWRDEGIVSGAGPKYSNFRTFTFTKGGIRIFFDEYKVASYAEGRYEVFVPLEKIVTVLKKSIAASLSQVGGIPK